MSAVVQQTGGDQAAIRPFRADVVPEAELIELRRRIKATRWPERETVTDASQGVQLATTQALARHWATEYDWRKIEAKMNALPQFITAIDGLDIRGARRRLGRGRHRTNGSACAAGVARYSHQYARRLSSRD